MSMGYSNYPKMSESQLRTGCSTVQLKQAENVCFFVFLKRQGQPSLLKTYKNLI